jgi:hypothetical protein
MKNYKNYITNKKKEFNEKIKLITPIIDFMDKFKLEYLIIGDDGDNYHYEGITHKNDSFILSYDPFESDSKLEKRDIFDLDVPFLTNLLKLLQTSFRLDDSFIFDMYRDYNIILNAFKVSTKNLELSHFNFLEYMDVDDHLDIDFPINSYDFQKTMFSHHPEVFDAFMDAIQKNKENIKEGKYLFDELILHPKIEKEYNSLLQKYQKKQKAKKFNL